MSTVSETTTGTWTLDPTHSSVDFTVVYMGVAPFRGTFREFEATLDDEGLRGSAPAAGIDVDNEQLAEHLASPEFFDTQNHPELRVETGPARRDGDRVSLEGTLEVKGYRATLTLTGTITEPVADPWGGRKLGLALSGSVDRQALGLTWNAPLPEGGTMLADEVELSASLVLVQSPEAA